MIYTRPEINPLGDAAQLIQLVGKTAMGSDVAYPFDADPAYDLDE